MGYLEGKVAIVTGAAAGIGTWYARALAAEGAKLSVCDIREDIADMMNELEAGGTPAIGAVADVSKPEDVRRVVDGTIERFGGVDVLISNAGVYPFTSVDDPLEKAIADFDAGYGTNFKGVFMFGRAVIPSMVERGGGDIINVATDHHWTCGAPVTWDHSDAPTCAFGAESPRPTGTKADVYDSSKSGITGLTIAWAKSLREHNIRVNAFCMGATDSAMLRSVFTDPPPEVVERWMKPQEIAQALVDLIKEGPEGRSGENIGFAVGHPVKLPSRQDVPMFAGAR